MNEDGLFETPDQMLRRELDRECEKGRKWLQKNHPPKPPKKPRQLTEDPDSGTFIQNRLSASPAPCTPQKMSLCKQGTILGEISIFLPDNRPNSQAQKLPATTTNYLFKPRGVLFSGNTPLFFIIYRLIKGGCYLCNADRVRLLAHMRKRALRRKQSVFQGGVTGRRGEAAVVRQRSCQSWGIGHWTLDIEDWGAIADISTQQLITHYDISRALGKIGTIAIADNSNLLQFPELVITNV